MHANAYRENSTGVCICIPGRYRNNNYLGSTHYRLCYGNTTIPVLMYARACNTQFQAEHEIAGLKAREVVVGAQCCRDVRVARRTQRAHIRPVSLPGKQQHAGNK